MNKEGYKNQWKNIHPCDRLNLRVRHLVLQEPLVLQMLLDVPSEVDRATDDLALWKDIPDCLHHSNLKVHVELPGGLETSLLEAGEDLHVGGVLLVGQQEPGQATEMDIEPMGQTNT